MNYKQLNEYDRAIINSYLQAGKTVAWVAEYLGRNRSTIYREIKRNGTDKDNGITAHMKSVLRRSNAKSVNLDKYSEFLTFLYDNFDKRTFSVDVLVGIAKKGKLFANIPSTQTVYNWINLNLLKIRKYQLLRSSNKYKRSKSVRYGKRRFRHRVPIHMRPKYIDRRGEVGHWEADSVTMARNGSRILTLVERKSRFGITIKVESGHMEKNFLAIKNEILKSKYIFKSITFDNGMEFNYMHNLKTQLGINVYYCHPYAPSERGTNEVWNGFLRRFLPKGTDLTKVTNNELQSITNFINKTPRRLLDYQSSLEVISI